MGWVGSSWGRGGGQAWGRSVRQLNTRRSNSRGQCKQIQTASAMQAQGWQFIATAMQALPTSKPTAPHTLTAGSEKRRPIRRLASNTVLVGFMATWFLAASPIRRSVSVKAT